MVEQESKVAHLTALLSETEKDLIKHVQMTNLLKEEIRRHQRSVEREKHAENLEYLKNVVVKVSFKQMYFYKLNQQYVLVKMILKQEKLHRLM